MGEAPPTWIWEVFNKLMSFAGILAMLVYFIGGLKKGEWITRREHDAVVQGLCRERDEWKQKAEQGSTTVQQAVHSLHQVVGALQQRDGRDARA